MHACVLTLLVAMLCNAENTKQDFDKVWSKYMKAVNKKNRRIMQRRVRERKVGLVFGMAFVVHRLLLCGLNALLPVCPCCL